MIQSKDGKDLVIPVNESFWPIFLTSRLTVKAVMHSWCFCLNGTESSQQVIFVLPTEGATRIPNIRDLERVFKSRKRGAPFLEIRDLPVPLHRLTSITGVNLYHAIEDGREMIVLYANTEPIGQACFADSVLVSFQISLDDTEIEIIWPKSMDACCLISVEHFPYFNAYNVIALVRSGVEVSFTSRISVLASIGGEELSLYESQRKPSPRARALN